MSAAPPPLAGLTVVEIGHSIAAPYAGHVLGELGARVLKVEQPSGDYARGWGPPFASGSATVFHAINRGKESIVADLTDAAQRADVERLILDQADIVLQNLKFESLDRLGLSAATFLERKRSLIWANLGAYGAVGPLKHHPGYDPLMQAMSGLMSLSGEDGGRPVRVPVSIVDMGTGLWAVIGVLSALQRLKATRRGGIVDTSLYETAIAWMTVPIVSYLASGEAPTKTGSANAQIVPYQAFATQDGDLMVAAGNDGLFRKLCAALDLEHLADDDRFSTNAQRVVHRASLIAILETRFAALSIEDVTDRLAACGVPCGPIQTVDQVVVHPQTSALGMLQSASDDLTLVALPLCFDGMRPRREGLGPALGEASDSAGPSNG